MKVTSLSTIKQCNCHTSHEADAAEDQFKGGVRSDSRLRTGYNSRKSLGTDLEAVSKVHFIAQLLYQISLKHKGTEQENFKSASWVVQAPAPLNQRLQTETYRHVMTKTTTTRPP